MKKNLIAVLMALAAFGVCAAEGEGYVYSSNAHAIVKVNTFSTNVLIAVPWTFYTPTGSSDTNLPINRLVKPEGLDDGDMLLNVTQTNPQKYQSWMLTKENGIGTWEPAISVEKSNADVKTGLVQKEGQISYGAGAEDPVQRGIGLWLIRTNPKDTGGNWKPIYLYGQWTKASATVSIKGGVGVTNAVMVAYPACTSATAINEMDWDFVGEKDSLSVPNGTDAWNLCLWDKTEQKWYTTYTEDIEKKVGSKTRIVHQTHTTYDITVPAGCGFWYIRRDVAGDCTISWPE